MFGRNESFNLVGGCVNPAAPGGGPVELNAILPDSRGGPTSDPNWLAVDGQIIGECVSDSEGSVMRIRIGNTAFAEELRSVIDAAGSRPNWGLHRLDMPLVQGNLIDLVDRQARAWAAGQRGAARQAG